MSNFIKFFYEINLNGDCRELNKIILPTVRSFVRTCLLGCKKCNTIHHLFKFLKSYSQKEVIINE